MYYKQSGTHYRNIYLDQCPYFFTSSITEYQPVLKENEMKRLILQAWSIYREKYHIQIYGYVIMPEHIHAVVYGEKGLQIQSFIQQSLRRSALSILEQLKKWPDSFRLPLLEKFSLHANGKAKYKVWKEQARGIPLETDEMVLQKLNYIHQNPLRRGLVQDITHYLYSSYRNYELDDSSIFSIDKVPYLRVGW